MPDVDEFKRIEAEAALETERQLGSRPKLSAISTSLLTGVAAYIVLVCFSAATGTHESSGMVILVFVLVIAGLTYWVLRMREDKWIRAQIQNEIRISQHRSPDVGKRNLEP